MKPFLLALCCVFISFTVCEKWPFDSTSLLAVRQTQFADWKKLHAKTYQNEIEHQNRFQIWLENMELIETHNKQKEKLGYTLAMNAQGDLSWAEFSSFFLQSPKKSQRSLADEISSSDISEMKNVRGEPPAEFDWRDKNVVTPVKDQERCGSCWAFGSVAVIESAWALAGNPLVSLSEGQLVDCTQERPYYNEACCGGWFPRSWDYVKKNGISSEISYPYLHQNNKCVNNTQKFMKCNVTDQPAARISSYTEIKPARNEKLMLESSYSHGPIIVTIHVNQTWRFYREGVYNGNDCNTWELNHNPVVVGWGKDNSTGWDYWILKNSWGPNWGLGGYIKMRRGINQCGIAEETGFVKV